MHCTIYPRSSDFHCAEEDNRKDDRVAMQCKKICKMHCAMQSAEGNRGEKSCNTRRCYAMHGDRVDEQETLH